MIRVKIFTGIVSGESLQKEINTWIEGAALGPEDIVTVTQSECGTSENGQVTITVWYTARLVEPVADERGFQRLLKKLDDEVPF